MIIVTIFNTKHQTIIVAGMFIVIAVAFSDVILTLYTRILSTFLYIKQPHSKGADTQNSYQ